METPCEDAVDSTKIAADRLLAKGGRPVEMGFESGQENVISATEESEGLPSWRINHSFSNLSITTPPQNPPISIILALRPAVRA